MTKVCAIAVFTLGLVGLVYLNAPGLIEILYLLVGYAILDEIM